MKNVVPFAGVWLDLREAKIVFLPAEGEATFEIISSGVDEGRAKGGSRSKTPWGPMDRVSEPGHQRRKEQQIKAYMDRIGAALQGVSDVAIIGPGEAKVRLRNHLMKIPHRSYSIQRVEPADSHLSEKQLIARVRSMIET